MEVDTHPRSIYHHASGFGANRRRHRRAVGNDGRRGGGGSSLTDSWRSRRQQRAEQAPIGVIRLPLPWLDICGDGYRSTGALWRRRSLTDISSSI